VHALRSPAPSPARVGADAASGSAGREIIGPVHGGRGVASGTPSWLDSPHSAHPTSSGRGRAASLGRLPRLGDPRVAQVLVVEARGEGSCPALAGSPTGSSGRAAPAAAAGPPAAS